MNTLTVHAKKIISFTFIFAMFVFFVKTGTSFAIQDDVVCTADAKQCSDGSFVGRVAPNCDFAPCPDEHEVVKTEKEKFRNTMKEKNDIFVTERNRSREMTKEMNEQSKQLHENTTEVRRQMQNMAVTGTKISLSDEEKEQLESLRKEREEFRKSVNARMDDLRAKMEERRKEREKKREEYRAKLSEEKQSRLIGMTENLTKRIVNIVINLNQILIRLSIRIEKLEQQGMDLSEAKAELENVQILFREVDDKISVIKEVSSDVFTSDDPQKYSEDIRDAVNLAKDNIKEIHSSIAKIARIVKKVAKKSAMEQENTLNQVSE